MEFHHFLQFMSSKRKTVYGIIAIFLLVGVLTIAVQRFKYSASSQLLVVQEYSGPVDAYTASKSTEHLSNVLASVINSNSFFTKVMAASPTINSQYFGDNPKDQMKEWGKTVEAKNINDTGIIAISVYHPNKVEAQKIAGAVNYVLMTQHSAYDGAGEAVKVRLIDQPISSTIPVKPNIPLILGSMVILGFLSSLVYIYLLSENVAVKQREFANETQPAFLARTSVPKQTFENKFTDFRPFHTEQPAYRPTSQLSPYGQRSRVTLTEQPIITPDDMEGVIDPETIVRQGNMHNILD